MKGGVIPATLKPEQNTDGVYIGEPVLYLNSESDLLCDF